MQQDKAIETSNRRAIQALLWALKPLSRHVSLPGRFGCPRETFQRLWGLVCRNRRLQPLRWHCRPHAERVHGVDLSGRDLLAIQIDVIHVTTI